MIQRSPRRRTSPPPADADAVETAEIFRTLADPTRLRLLAALFNGEHCVHELCAGLAMSQTAVSHQLRLLRVARLVRPRRVGREIFYSLEDEHVMSLIAAARAHATERRG